MIRLTVLGESTHLGSTLCAACPHSPVGCCGSPPAYDWSDLGRVVLRGGRDFLLDLVARGLALPTSGGLALQRARRRDGPAAPRTSRCVLHGPRGCTVDPARRPATCNYYLCDDAFLAGGEARGDAEARAARRVHGTLRDLYAAWDVELAADVAARCPEGVFWDAAFLDWLGAAMAARAPAAASAVAAAAGALSLDPGAPSAMIPRMAKITLKLRDLHSGNSSFHEVADEPAAIAYLQARPRFTEILGVVFEGLTPEQNTRLKAAMRPLDEDERAAEATLVEVAERAAEAAAAKRAKEEEAARAAHREALKTANPNRPMDVRYRFDGSIAAVDPEDTRAITDEARAAILEWVAERNEWVEARNQCVGEAKMTVVLGALPKPGASRITNGSFIPVAAAPKKAE